MSHFTLRPPLANKNRRERYMNREFLFLIKYGAVGVANTAITIVGFFLLRQAGVGIDVANFVAYAAGVLNSFLCNKLWVFRSHGGHWGREALLFLIGALVCWALQWLVLRGLLLYLSEDVAFILGMGFYTAAYYLFNRFLTFKPKGASK